MTGGQDRDQNVRTAEGGQRRAIQDCKEEQAERAKVPEQSSDAAPAIRTRVLKQDIQSAGKLNGQNRAWRVLDNGVQMRS